MNMVTGTLIGIAIYASAWIVFRVIKIKHPALWSGIKIEDMGKDVIIDGNNNALLIKKNCLKSESFNKTRMMNEQTKEVVSKLILEKALSIPKEEYWRHGEIDELIRTSLNLGLTKVADRLIQYT